MATQAEIIQEIKKPEELVSQVKEQADITSVDPKLPAGTAFTPTEKKLEEGETITTDVTTPDLTITPQQTKVDNLEVPVPQKVSAAFYENYASPNTPEATTTQGKLSQEALIGDIVGTVSEQSLVDAEQGVVSEKSTIKYQLGELFKSFEEGTPPPPWAAPAVRTIGAMMAQRGLGASSMAAAAITQAVMEAGIPIASQDAQLYATLDLTNLSNRQQATLQNAALYAAMDKSNLDFRRQAAVTNAQSFLNLDMQNLSLEQRALELNFQTETQKMFTDQAAVNASRQFNATSQAQVDQFYAEMQVQVANANANRLAAQEQFNVNEGNAMKQFVASVNDARDRFETQLAVQIDQSNAVWRRDINTANTALQNETNRINTQNLLNITQSAQNKLWQKYRDEAAWIFNMSESAVQREHELGMLAMEIAENQDVYDTQLRNGLAGELGKAAIRTIFG